MRFRLVYLFSLFIYLPSAFAGKDCISCTPEMNSLKSEKQIWQLKDTLDRVNIELDRCSYANPKRNPKNIIFLFEGYKGFSKELLIGFKKFQSLNPKCEKQKDGSFAFRFPDGTWISADQAKGRMDDMVKTGGTAVGLKNYILEGFCKSGMDFSETEVFYYGQEEGVEDAVKCARQMSQMQYSNGLYPTFSVLGYSRGGARSIEFANKIRSQKIKIDNGMSVDPVPTDFLGTAAKIPLAVAGVGVPSHTPSNFTIPDNVPWVNYWQESDNRWKKTLDLIPNNTPGLHGSPVTGAIVNKKVSPPVESNNGPNGAHWRIFNTNEISESIVSFYKKIQKLPPKDKCFDKNE